MPFPPADWAYSSHVSTKDGACSSPGDGYHCFEEYSRRWGEYSPYFSVKDVSSYPVDIPSECEVTFAQVLSRHGARYPTAHKGKTYADLIERIQNQTARYGSDFHFIESFEYSLNTDSLVEFGKEQLFESGVSFYERYANLSRTNVPFVRSSWTPRVIESAEHFMRGFSESRKQANGEPVNKTAVDVVMYDGTGFNSSLNLGACPAFEKESKAQPWHQGFMEKHFSKTLQRVKKNLPGAQLDVQDIIYLMDLCSFHTISATPDATNLSPFCPLFTEGEWEAYDYFSTLRKYYKFGKGNELAPPNGIAFVNELIARLTNQPVHDHSSVNRTLDSDPKTFPLGLPLYADFSHDNEMAPIYAAMGIAGPILNKKSIFQPEDVSYFTSSRLIPFAARMYVEKLECGSEKEEYVRVLINDRVMPVEGCAADQLGRCKLSDFVNGMTYASSGDAWKLCYE